MARHGGAAPGYLRNGLRRFRRAAKSPVRIGSVGALVAASFAGIVATAGPAHATTTTWSNSTPINVADLTCPADCVPGVGSVYPSTISVSGVSGTLTHLSVTLKNVTHTYASQSVPVISVPADITAVEDAPGAGAAVAFDVTATGTPDPAIACVEGAMPVSSGDVFAVGVHRIDCTATNPAGSDSGSFTITVQSVPVLHVPADITVTEPAPGGTPVPFTVTADGFPAPAIGCAEGTTPVSSGDVFGAGVHTVACTAINTAGSDSGSFTITVQSVPVISVPADITAVEDAPGAGAAVAFDVTATGTPDPAIACVEGAMPVSSGDVFAVGVHRIDCTATNPAGSDSGSFTITVQSVPVLHVPDDFAVTENPAGSGTASVPFVVTADGVPAPTVACELDGQPVTSPATLAIGTRTIDCTATNAAGAATGSFTVTVEPAHRMPAADAGGPYAIREGQALRLDGTGTTNPEHRRLRFSWDVNGDGVFGDAFGATPTLRWAQLRSLGISDGPFTGMVAVRVRDGLAQDANVSAPSAWQVANAAPKVSIVGRRLVTDHRATFTLRAGDRSLPDRAATFSWLIRWGDGRPPTRISADRKITVTHRYAPTGTYTVTVTSTDKDGGTSRPASRQVVIVGLPEPSHGGAFG